MPSCVQIPHKTQFKRLLVMLKTLLFWEKEDENLKTTMTAKFTYLTYGSIRTLYMTHS